MVANIVSMISKAFVSNSNVKATNAVTTVSKNPFASPFVTTSATSFHANYAKNKPVQGGYFAGYYNGKANIVGQRLFVEA